MTLSIRSFLLVLCLASIPMSFAADRVLRVFWTMYEEKEDIADPVDMPKENVPHLARVVLADNLKNFIGFVDEDKTTIQFMLVAPGRVLIDMPVPAQKGSYQLQVDAAKAFEVIDALNPPYLRYKDILGLKFQKWNP